MIIYKQRYQSFSPKLIGHIIDKDWSNYDKPPEDIAIEYLERHRPEPILKTLSD